MGAEIKGVNHIVSLAKDLDETVRFYDEVLDIKVRRIASDEPGRRHYSLDLGGGSGLDFFEASPGTERSTKGIAGLHHLALTTTPAFIETVEPRLKKRSVSIHEEDRGIGKTIYFSDPNGITLQLYPTG